MIKISNKEIIDVIKYADNKAIFVEKNPIGDLTKYKASYFVLNFENGEKEVITKSAYLLKKLGSSYEKITETIANFVNCDAAIFDNRSVITVFSNGQAGMFDSQGEIVWNGVLKHNEAVVNGLAQDGGYFWSVCESEDCVIRYNAENFNVDIRIGSKEADTFNKPSFISSDDENIYVCCANGRVRKIDRTNLTVSDVGTYDGIKRFYKLGKFSIICSYDGLYIDKD